jgi:hypothetical protein
MELFTKRYSPCYDLHGRYPSSNNCDLQIENYLYVLVRAVN